MTENSGLDIAIVGLAGRFPGAADIDGLWQRILRGKPTVSRFTPEELAASGVPAREYRRPDYVPVYGVLDDIDRFDAEFFGYTPRDARLIDPQQRLFLECAWQALESSGHLALTDDELVGVYAATAMSTYLLKNLLAAGDAAGSEYELLLGNDKDGVATRVAYHLGLRGPACTIQTACSSSLVAVHVACQALLTGECDLALAGAAHMRLPMRSGYRYEPGGIMAADGVCRPFDAAATGAVGGNGAGIVVLRRLDDAETDGDTIYAVIKGSAVNNDGRAKVGYTAPSVDGQIAVIRAAQQAAGVDPATIGYVEAHGTGTALGDQIEFAALHRAFGPAGRRALGSVKAVTGHLDVAAGVTGLIKACLAVQHGVVPPSPYFIAPHPDLPMAGSSFYVNPEPEPWPVTGSPRRAAVSSFGIGGTNAHVVLEQAPAVATTESVGTEHILVLSARSRAALTEARDRLREHLIRTADPLADVAYTLQTTRRRFEHRLAVACRDRDEAIARLADGLDSSSEAETDGSVAFLFPGQGTQYPGMGGELYRTEPVFRESMDAGAAALRSHLGLDLRDVLYQDRDNELLRQTRITQPALFVVEYALARLWQHRGIRPAAMAGHSVGEYVAACLAGVFDFEDALAIVAARGERMQSMPPGAMLSVALPWRELAERLPDEVELAAANAPRLCVVAGEPRRIAAFAQSLRADGVKCTELHTSHAFHTSMMEPVVAEFAEYVSGFTLHTPQIPVLSNVTGDWLGDAEARDPKYWARQLREPVRFADCARRLLDRPHALLEVGPGTTLTTLVRQHPDAYARSTPSLGESKAPQPERLAMASALGRLWLAGVEVDWTADGERRRRVPLPTYPFQRERYWIDRGSPVVPDAPAARPRLSPREAIRDIWANLLGIPDVRDDQDFFQLGGHSLLGTQVIARIREALGVDLPASALFDTPTIATLAESVEELLAAQRQPRQESVQLPDLMAEIRALSPTELQARLAELRRADSQ
ncbi:type I polyketide synthase [Nocardia sp. NPDC060256]|uniref:type I polyketide synthase n=1 Tax=unclassified Nocardia TaxID=2637762 RepID=UPI0036584914